MRTHALQITFAGVLVISLACTAEVLAKGPEGEKKNDDHGHAHSVQLGPRPFYLVEKMTPGPLKDALQQCSEGPFKQTEFSIGHRGGGTLQIPEHTKESHEAGARMGAGILECDVTFTKDGELVCRHDQCDLHTTTNILVTGLAGKCSVPFSPAEFDPVTGARTQAATALCCTSDLTLDEFKSLVGKMDASDPDATTPQEFQGGTPNWRTDLYATGGTLLSHRESIALIKSLGAKFTPELKSANLDPRIKVKLEDVFGGQGVTAQEAYAQKMTDEYKQAGIPPKEVFAQSFNYADILYWISHEPEFGQQAVFLDDANVPDELPTLANLQKYKADGVNIWAPPMWALLAVSNGQIVPSQYALNAKAAQLDLITWTLERSGILADGNNGFYYQTFDSAIKREGDMMKVLDVLAKDVGILGIFSDWAATVTYYANCMGIR